MASTSPSSDPAGLDEAVPSADRGQGTMQPLPQAAIDEAAEQGVDLDDDADEGKATSAGSLDRETE